MEQQPASKNIYTLTKYSCAVFKQPSSTQNVQASKDCDWHHHTQPNLRLLLEMRKSAQGMLETVRLRVVWTVDRGCLFVNNKPLQENMIFEDVDLLTIRKHVHTFPTQGLPLKAVYRDNMVGIRYLPLQAQSNAQSEYRRFQITFQASHAAAAFIEAIRDVCPCKPSPVNTIRSEPVPRGNDTSQDPFPSQIPTRDQMNPSIMPTSRYSEDRFPLASQTTTHHFDLPPEFSRPSQLSFPSHSTSHVDLRTSNTSSLNAHIRQTLPHESANLGQSPSPCCPQLRSETLTRRQTVTLFDSDTHDLSDPQVDSSLPIPTPLSSSTINNNTNEESHAKDHATATTAVRNKSKTTATSMKDHIMASLYEACKLDYLSQEDLEQLVAHIVREDGFTQLLEKMDNLWRIKGLVDA